MDKSDHIITFIKRLKKFSQAEGITSMLRVDADNTSGDISEIQAAAGGIIDDIDNGISELIDMLVKHYEATDNTKDLHRLQSIIK